MRPSAAHGAPQGGDDLVAGHRVGRPPTVNWSRAEEGRITAIRATFDLRLLLGG